VANKDDLQAGDIAVNAGGTPELYTTVVYVEDREVFPVDEDGKVAVSTIDGPAWGISVKPEELTVVHHVDPATREDRLGVGFSKEWFDENAPAIRAAVQAFRAGGNELSS